MGLQFISYPKSGRSWLRFALAHLGAASRIHFHHDTFEFNDGAKPAPDLDFDRRLQRCLSAQSTVYLTRDPRDILVSLYYQVTGRFRDFFDYQGGLSDFVRDDYFGANHLDIFRRQWDEICSRGLALKVSYEDCHRDFPGVLASVLNHFDIEISEAKLAEAAERARFENMKKIELAGDFGSPWLRPRNGAPKVRRGVVGGYHDELSDEDINYLDRIFGAPETGIGAGPKSS